MPISFADLPDRVKVELFDLISPELNIGERVAAKAVLIDGIEATQSIQYYKSERHLTSAASRGMDNALVLAADKPAWVRVYVRTTRFSPVSGVRGSLTVERRRRGFLWDTVLTLTPQPPGTVTARPFIDNDTERSGTLNSLNFILPAADCRGILRLTAQVTDADGKVLDTSAVVIHATLRQTLRLRGIMVRYDGPSTAAMVPNAPPPPTITLAAPTLADLRTTASRALLAMPVQATGSFALASQITFTLPLDDPRSGAGACSANWDTLLGRLVQERTNDGNRSDVVYYGLLPAGMPLNVPGCGQDGVGAGAVNDVATLLHEIGHGYGFAHTPCGAAGTTDADYPSYRPHPSASIGEYGIDISTGVVFSPATTFDYMSYCGPQWISLYQYGRLVGHPRLAPSWISDNPIWDQYVEHDRFKMPDDIPDPLLDPDPWRLAELRPESVISIIGIMNSAREIDVRSVARVRAGPTLAGARMDLKASLVDANLQVLARAPLHVLASHGGCGCCDGARTPGEPPYWFQALVPDVAPGYAITIGEPAEPLWQRTAPSFPPAIGEFGVEVRDDTAALFWQAESSGEQLDAWVQWSAEDGRVWHGLATGLAESGAEVSLAPVPAGPALLRLLLHDGFFTVASEPMRIEVPERPPAIAIHAPASGQTLFAGGPMRLWGSVSGGAGEPLEDESARWLVDGREAGRGVDLWVTAPPPGEHRASLILATGHDEHRATVAFTTIGGYREEC